MSDDLGHDERVARLQRVLDRLDQVTKQAKDLSRTAAELHQEAIESIQLIKQSVPAVTDGPKLKSRPTARKQKKR